MIILEGVDKAGKTTLAKQLAEELKLEVRKFGIPVGDPIPSYIEELSKDEGPIIYDRFLYGEVPYSIVKKRTRYMKYLELRVLDLAVQSRPHLVIYVRPPRNIIDKRVEKLGDAYVDRNEVQQLIEEYDEMFSVISSNLMEYSADHQYGEILFRIQEFVLNREKYNSIRKEWLKLKYPGIGTLTPTYLFVGEQYNYNAPYQLPFCSQSGEFLFRSLDKAGFNMRQCHFTNAYNGIGIIPPALLDILQPSKIICLGQIAKDAIKYCKISVDRNAYTVPHPSYWKRFHTNAGEEYIEMLRALK